MPRFSIVIPVYNAQRYLSACVDSVRAQTFDDIEIVCVDDGSTDASPEMLEHYAEADKRVRVVSKENGGPSSARNLGIAEARGEFVCFLDSDDVLEPHACERIAAEFGKRPCDAVVFGWSYFPAAKADRFVREHAEVRDAYYPEFAADVLFKEMSNPYLRLAVRRDALLRSGVRFDEQLNVGEDAQFLFALYPRIGGISLISDKLYRYQLPRPGSLMADNKPDDANLCACDIAAMAAIFADWGRAGLLGEYGAELLHWYVRNPLYTILRLDPPVRDELVSLSKQMWLANFSDEQLRGLALDPDSAELVGIVLNADERGRLSIGEKELAAALRSWRLAEYGVADIAVTVVDRTRFGLANSTLAKGGPQFRELLARRVRQAGEGLRSGRASAGRRSAANQKAASSSAGFADGSVAACQSQDGSEAGAGASQATPEAGVCPSQAEAEHAPANPVVSVVVPVFNVERYLDQALSSVEAQTLKNIEIICVNDGSTDASPAILREHALRDARVRIVDKANGGYGSACNRGIAEARGQWIAVFEPDDWIEPEMYAAMVDYVATFNEPIDIVKTPYWRVWLPDTDEERTINCSYRGRIRPKHQPFKLTDDGVVHLIIHHPSIWSALYSRAFIERTGLRFMEIPGAGWADNPFLAESLSRADSIVYLDTPFYHYREETPEKTANFGKNGWRVSIDRWHDMMDVYERLGVTNEAIRRAHVRRGFTYAGLILEYHDLSEVAVRDGVVSMFDRMNDELVFSEPNISPGSKQLYAQLKGLEMPDINPLPYAARVVEGGLYNLANTGIGMTIDTFKQFTGAHAKREGK